jgi:hypothetical protein
MHWVIWGFIAGKVRSETAAEVVIPACNPVGLVDPVQNPVGPAASRVVPVEGLVQRLAGTVRVNGKRVLIVSITAGLLLAADARGCYGGPARTGSPCRGSYLIMATGRKPACRAVARPPGVIVTVTFGERALLRSRHQERWIRVPEDSDIHQSDVVRTALRGWEANLDGRAPVEQALTRAVLVGHQLLGIPVERPSAASLDEAFERLNSVQPGLFATWESARMPLINLSPASPEVILDALRRYLLQALGTHDPQNLGLTNIFLDLAMQTSMSSPVGPDAPGLLATVPVAFLIGAAYQAESGYMEPAGDMLDHATRTIADFGSAFPVPEAAPAVLAVCRETRKQVHGELRQAARLKHWQYKQDAKAGELIGRAEDLLAAGAYGRAREQTELALEIHKQLAEALPGHPSTHELGAYLRGLRARISLQSGQAQAAVQDAIRSLQGYQRLTTYDREHFAGQLDIAHELWVAVTTAAAAGR